VLHGIDIDASTGRAQAITRLQKLVAE